MPAELLKEPLEIHQSQDHVLFFPFLPEIHYCLTRLPLLLQRAALPGGPSAPAVWRSRFSQWPFRPPWNVACLLSVRPACPQTCGKWRIRRWGTKRRRASHRKLFARGDAVFSRLSVPGCSSKVFFVKAAASLLQVPTGKVERELKQHRKIRNGQMKKRKNEITKWFSAVLLKSKRRTRMSPLTFSAATTLPRWSGSDYQSRESGVRDTVAGNQTQTAAQIALPWNMFACRFAFQMEGEKNGWGRQTMKHVLALISRLWAGHQHRASDRRCAAATHMAKPHN